MKLSQCIKIEIDNFDFRAILTPLNRLNFEKLKILKLQNLKLFKISD